MDLDYRFLAAFIFGLILLYVFARIIYVPVKITARLIFNALMGGAVLWIINLVGAFFDFSLPINPITAIVVGFLGIPGVVLVIALHFLMV